MAGTLGLVYVISLFVFLIAVLVYWVRVRRDVRGVTRYGITAGLLWVGLEVLVLVTSRALIPLETVLFADAIGFLRITAFTIVGIHACRRLGIPSLPLIGVRPVPVEPVAEQQPLSDEEVFQPIGEAPPLSEPPTTVEIPAPGSELRVRLGPWLATVLAVAAGAIAYSALLFAVTSPRLSEAAKVLFGESVPRTTEISLVAILMVIQYAFAEEIVFRLGIQNLLSRLFRGRVRGTWIAILLTAALWTIGHAGLIEPDWVKLAQIFPIGIALGWMLLRLGAESCIATHVLFNLVMLFLAPTLMR